MELQSRVLGLNGKNTRFLFGDGAGAALVGTGDDDHRVICHVVTTQPEEVMMARRGAPGFLPAVSESGHDPFIRLDGPAR